MTLIRYDARLLSDLHKDAYGFRPSRDWFARWDSLSIDSRNQEWDRMVKDVEASIVRESQEQAQAQEAWLARTTDGASSLGVTRSTFVRWDMDAHSASDDFGYYLYLNGIVDFAFQNRQKEELWG